MGAGSTLDPKFGSDLETDDSTHATRENGKHRDSHNETFQGRAGQAPRQAGDWLEIARRGNGLWLLCGREMGQMSVPKLWLSLPGLNFLPAPKKKALGFLMSLAQSTARGFKVKGWGLKAQRSDIRHGVTLYYKSHGSCKKVMNSKDPFPEKKPQKTKNTYKHICTKF